MISIIIIVKNDPEIELTLKELSSKVKASSQTEILVVDASQGKLDAIHKKYPSVKWLNFDPIAGKRVTIPNQRNVGVKSAKGNIIVFIDSSCIPEHNWLEEITRPIMEGKEKIVCGNTGSTDKETLHEQTHELRKNQRYLDECATINLAIAKEVFENNGYFDESFSYGSDVDFTWRAIDNGYKILYQPTAYITHNWGTFRQDLKRSFTYGKARARLYLKHKHRRKDLLSKDLVAIIYPLYLLLLPVTIIFPFYPLFILIPAIKNYNKKPFHTIIDHLAYGAGVLRETVFQLSS